MQYNRPLHKFSENNYRNCLSLRGKECMVWVCCMMYKNNNVFSLRLGIASLGYTLVGECSRVWRLQWWRLARRSGITIRFRRPNVQPVSLKWSSQNMCRPNVCRLHTLTQSTSSGGNRSIVDWIQSIISCLAAAASSTATDLMSWESSVNEFRKRDRFTEINNAGTILRWRNAISRFTQYRYMSERQTDGRTNA